MITTLRKLTKATRLIGRSLNGIIDLFIIFFFLLCICLLWFDFIIVGKMIISDSIIIILLGIMQHAYRPKRKQIKSF